MPEQDEQAKIAGSRKIIDTGYSLHNYGTHKDFFTSPDETGKSWIGPANWIWGDAAGQYRVNEEGDILHDSEPTGFFIKDMKVYGPSKDLPWKA
jgi:hypothetical protein